MLKRKDGLPHFWGEWENYTHRAAVPASKKRTLIKWWVNKAYSVRLYMYPRHGDQTKEVREWNPDTDLVCISIMRRDEKPAGERSWKDFQRIKDELGYADRLAVEVYPPKDQVCDPSNMYYLWVLPRDFELPFVLFTPGEVEYDLPGSIKLGGAK